MSRNVGLDILRSLAILMVIINHGWFFYSQYFGANNVTFFGYLGVELFFVLSGFLIGHILIKDVLEHFTLRSIKIFYIRRWLRTIPLYYLVLLIMLLIGNEPHWQYLFFIQNFWPDYRFFLPVAWSLSIEEWFYVFTPFILIVYMKFLKRNKVKVFFTTCISIICAVLLARVCYVLLLNPRWDYDLRRSIPLRMDSLMIGVLIAGVKVYFNRIYTKLNNYTFLLTVVSLLGLMIMWAEFYYIEGGGQLSDHSFFGRTFSFTFISILAALLLIALERNALLNITLAKSKMASMFKAISTTSYALYLVHKPIFELMAAHVKTKNLILSTAWFLIGSVLSYIIAFLLHKFFETPVMKIRDRITKTESASANKRNNGLKNTST